MRTFSDKEKDLLRDIVKIYKDISPSSLVKLQVAKFLRSKLNFFALKWETKSKPQVTIFKSIDNTLPDNEIDKIYYQIADFVYFIEELEGAKFIKLQHIPSENTEVFSILFDRQKYEFNSNDNSFYRRMQNVEFNGKTYNVTAYNLESWKTFCTDFAFDLDKYAWAIIYPLPRLIDFVENDFKTIEHRRFETQKALTWISIFVAIAIGILSPIITQCTSPKGEKEKIERIETAIKGNRTVTIDSVKTLSNDTFNVNEIQPKAKPASKPQPQKKNPLKEQIPQ